MGSTPAEAIRMADVVLSSLTNAAAVRNVMSGEWVQNLARLKDDLDRPVATAVAAARTPGWH